MPLHTPVGLPWEVTFFFFFFFMLNPCPLPQTSNEVRGYMSQKARQSNYYALDLPPRHTVWVHESVSMKTLIYLTSVIKSETNGCIAKPITGPTAPGISPTLSGSFGTRASKASKETAGPAEGALW